MLVQFVITLSVLLGFCGLGIEVGMMQLEKQKLQSAADAAALEASYSIPSKTAELSGAQADAALNGFTNNGTTTTVTVTYPPATGLYAGNALAVQATVTQRMNPMFIPGAITLSATSTALASPQSCVYLMSTTQQPTLAAQAETGSQITATCSFYLGLSYNFNPNSTSTGAQFYVAANASYSAASSGAPTPPAIFGVPRQSDPLAYVPTPSIQPGCLKTNFTIDSPSAPQTIYPGNYCGGLEISHTGYNVVTLSPGTYVIAGSLTFQNDVRVAGTGVTFYLTQIAGYSYGTMSINNTLMTLSAPTSGPLQGILFFSDRTMPALASGSYEFTFQSMNAGSTMDGILYAPGQAIFANSATLQGTRYFGMDAASLSIQNSGFHPSANYSTLAGGNPFRPAPSALAE